MIYVQAISDPPPIWQSGGTTRQADAFIRLISMETKVILVTQKQYAQAACDFYAHNKQVTVFESFYDLSETKPMSLFNIYNLKKLINDLSKDENEKIIVHSLENKSLLTIQMAILCMFNKFEFWLSPFGQGSAIFEKNFSIYKNIYMRLCAKAKRIICQNNEELNLYKKQIKTDNLIELPLLIDPEIDKNMGKIQHVSENKIRFGFLGRNTRLKGIIQIIDFLNGLSHQTDLELSLALSGEGPYVDAKITDANIEIEVIQIDNDFDRFSFYKKIDVFIILPTVQEETSLATLEAALMGCRIICNQNCMFSNASMFGEICCLPEEFNVSWLHSKKSSDVYQAIRHHYCEINPKKYLRLLDD